MRVFISVNFDNKTLDNIVSVQNNLKKYAKGSFTHPENIHLTLAFLGEITKDQLKTIKQTMNTITVEKTTVSFNRIGCFKRDDGNIWWMGLEHNNKLIQLQKHLSNKLADAGFSLEKRAYKPHITIARRVKEHFEIDKNSIMDNHFTAEINSISLMLSQRIGEKLIYSEIFKVGI